MIKQALCSLVEQQREPQLPTPTEEHLGLTRAAGVHISENAVAAARWEKRKNVTTEPCCYRSDNRHVGSSSALEAMEAQETLPGLARLFDRRVFVEIHT